MNHNSLVQRISHLFFWIIPLPFLSAAYRPGHLVAYAIVGAMQACLIGTAGWALASGGNTGVSGKVVVQTAAAILVAGWAVASLALNMDAPPRGQEWLSTLPDQRFRYAALVLGALLCFGGFAIVAARLRDDGHAVLSSLGFASSIISTILFTLIFLVYPLVATSRFKLEAVSGVSPEWGDTVSAIFSSAGLVHRLSGYLSTILFTAALQRSGRVSWGDCMGVTAIALFAAVTSTVTHLPPAVVFVPPYLVGVSLLARGRVTAA